MCFYKFFHAIMQTKYLVSIGFLVICSFGYLSKVKFSKIFSYHESVSLMKELGPKTILNIKKAPFPHLGFLIFNMF